MGIPGLLQLLKPVTHTRKIQDYKGSKIGIDISIWIHRVLKGPAGKTYIEGGEKKHKYAKDTVKRLTKLIDLGVQLLVVFDGAPLPAKREVHIRRQRKRFDLRSQGMELLQIDHQLGMRKLCQAIEIDADILRRVMNELREAAIQFIVAPYEADAQLAYLMKQGLIDGVLTEDSDLLVFGASKILYKFDIHTLSCQQINLDEIRHKEGFQFHSYTHHMFKVACILGGCDYVQGIDGIGLKGALKIVRQATTLGNALLLLNVALQSRKQFYNALLIFLFQVVYCPKRKAMVNLNELNTHNLKELKLLQCCPWSKQSIDIQLQQYCSSNKIDANQLFGVKLSGDIATQIAFGAINPITLQKYHDQKNKNTFRSIKLIKPKILKFKSHSVKQINLKNFYQRRKNNLSKFIKINNSKVLQGEIRLSNSEFSVNLTKIPTQQSNADMKAHSRLLLPQKKAHSQSIGLNRQEKIRPKSQYYYYQYLNFRQKRRIVIPQKPSITLYSIRKVESQNLGAKSQNRKCHQNTCQRLTEKISGQYPLQFQKRMFPELYDSNSES